MRVTLLLVCVQLAFYGLRVFCGGTLTYGLAKLSEYGDTASGIYFNAEGFSILFRMDLTQTVLAIPVTYHQILVFCWSMPSFLSSWPLCVWGNGAVLGGAAGQHTTECVPGVSVVPPAQAPGKGCGGGVCAEHSGAAGGDCGHHSQPVSLLCLLYQHPVGDAYTTLSSLTQMGATLLAVAAALFTFWLHSVFLPVRYCLCAHPEYSLGQTFRRGLQSAKGVRGAFFRFRLSYILWFAASQLTYGAMDLFVTPYSSLGGMVFLQEAARARQGGTQTPSGKLR